MKAVYNAATGLDLTPETPADTTILALVANATARAEVLSRRYVLSPEPTPGLKYDDRLQVRIAIGRTKCYQMIASGELETRFIGGKHIMAETAVLRFLDPNGFAGQQEEVSALLQAA